MKFITVLSHKKVANCFEETDLAVDCIESVSIAHQVMKNDYPGVNASISSKGDSMYLVRETLPEIRAKIAASLKES